MNWKRILEIFLLIGLQLNFIQYHIPFLHCNDIWIRPRCDCSCMMHAHRSYRWSYNRSSFPSLSYWILHIIYFTKIILISFYAGQTIKVHDKRIPLLDSLYMFFHLLSNQKSSCTCTFPHSHPNLAHKLHFHHNLVFCHSRILELISFGKFLHKQKQKSWAI